MKKSREFENEERSDLEEVLWGENKKQSAGKLEIELDGSVFAQLLDQYTPEVGFVLTGHGPTNAYLHRFSLRDDDPCRFCAEELEEISHFVEGCPGLDIKLESEINGTEELDKFVTDSIRLVGWLRLAGRLRQAELE